MVSVRHVVLTITAAAVLALAVYLFVEVRSTAARPMPTATAATDIAPTPVAPTAPGTPSHVQVPRPGIAATPPPPTPAPTDPPPSDDQPFDVDEAMRSNIKLELVMDQANKAYDRQDFAQAKLIAGRVLAKQPGSIRMLRIMVSSSCMDGDLAVAQKYYNELPTYDRNQMKRRCEANGATLQEPPP